MFRLVSHLRPSTSASASASASRLRPSSTVPHLRPTAFATASLLRPSSTVPHLRPGASVTAYRLGPSSTVHPVTFNNTPINTPQYGVRRLSSLSPAKTGSNHGGKTDGDEKMPQDNSDANSVLTLVKKLAFKLMLVKIACGALGLICLDSGYSFCYAWYRERCIDAALEEAFPDSGSDDENFIKRPDAEKRFEDVVKSSSQYSVIVGSHGTGKSTLAWKVAHKTQGVIYVYVPVNRTRESVSKVADTLDFALQKALNWCKPIPAWFPVLLSMFSRKAEILLQPDVSPENSGILRTLADFELAAARYKARHGSCAVLIIDNTNAIAQYDLELLRTLQEKAKVAVDNRLYKVVFVTSDGISPEAMKENSAWSRANECRIGDLTENEARAYLEKCKVSCDTDKLIRECGTRILTLVTVCDQILRGNGLDEIIERYKSSEFVRFETCGVHTRIASRVALAVTEAGSLSWTDYAALCGAPQIAVHLLRKNIFVLDVANRVRFENKMLGAAVKEGIERQKAKKRMWL